MATSRTRKLLFLLFVLALNLLALEVAARAYKAVTRGPEPVVPPEIGRFDPRLGWALEANAEGSSERTGYRIDYRTNARGLRDDDAPYEKPPGTYRIVLLGDSRTFGFGVPVEKHFSRLLEGYFRDLEVINLGVSGYGVDQELLVLRDQGLRYQPDLVMAYVAHYGDHRHMHDDRFGKKKPRFRLAPDGTLIEVPLHGVVEEPEPGGLHGWLMEASTLYRIVALRLAKLWRPVEEDAQALYQRQKAQDEADARRPEFVREMNDLGAAIVAEMARESEQAGARFLLVTQVEALHRAMEERGIASLDVQDCLGNPLFSLPDDLAHINESGNGVLAWELARYLRAQGLVPPRNLE